MAELVFVTVFNLHMYITKVTKCQIFGKMNDLRQVNETPISNIIFMFTRGCYLHMRYYSFYIKFV